MAKNSGGPNLSATSAIILLTCLYWGALFGGAITSILFNIPGEPWSVATTFADVPAYPASPSPTLRADLTAHTESVFEAVLSSVRRTHRALVVHEAVKRGGYGAEIAAMIAEEAFDDLDAPPRRLAGLETPIPYAEHLEKGVIPQVDDIVRTAKEMVG